MKLFVTDMDGTLLSSQKTISPENRLAIRKLSDTGCKIALASGRGLDFLKQAMVELELNEGYLVAANGSELYDFGKKRVLCTKYLQPQLVEQVITLAKEWQISISLLGTEKRVSFVPEGIAVSDVGIDSWSQQLGLGAAQEFVKTNKIQRAIFRSNQLLRLDSLFQQMKANQMPAVVSDIGFLEVLPEDGGKGAGCEFIADYLKIPIEEVCAVGDQDNDAGMIKTAGFGIAMGNAVAHVKQLADWITQTNDENGVAYAIQKVLAEKIS